MTTIQLLRMRIPRVDNSSPQQIMSGANPHGCEISANRQYFTIDGNPWLPVMGEYHFSRCAVSRWKQELCKMKAGGIDIIATYIFWIHIEEIEGQFDWSGNRNLRHFVELCGELGLYAYPRIGPWAHGECRNGGFPDWLAAKYSDSLRKNDPGYLSAVKRLYDAVAAQLKGLFWKDGGPVIGIQIENELLDNAAHLRTLKSMAVSAGFDVPLYTMTGWGPAEVPDDDCLIPVFGGYPDAFWDRQITEWSRTSRKHYFFTHLRDDNTIGADLRARPGVATGKNAERFPYGTCETGGGMQVSYHRRPLIAPDDIAAIACAKIGSGSNLLGYYMYHGGINPTGRLTYMQESQDTGYPNDLPVKNYDFQAPLSSYGQPRQSYFALRPLHLFLQNFGSRLAPLPMFLPEKLPVSLDDTTTLRWACRSDGKSGFLFINNYQRIETLHAIENVQFKLCLPEADIQLPSHPVTVPEGCYGFWPFHFDLAGVDLIFASAQPLCVLNDETGPSFVFFAHEGVPAEFVIDRAKIVNIEFPGNMILDDQSWTVQGLRPGVNCVVKLTSSEGKEIRILLLTQAQARQCSKVHLWGMDRLVITPGLVYFSDDRLYLQAVVTSGSWQSEESLWIYPPPPDGSTAQGQQFISETDGIFTRRTISLQEPSPVIQVKKVRDPDQALPVKIGPAGVAQAPMDEDFTRAAVWHIDLPDGVSSSTDEILLEIDYVGDVARVYLEGRLIDDDFYHGAPWQIGLSQLPAESLQTGIDLLIIPLRDDAPIYLPPEALPDFGESNEIACVKSITLHVVRNIEISAR